MAEFKQGNLIVKDNKGVYLGDAQEISITHDTTLSGLSINAPTVDEVPIIGGNVGDLINTVKDKEPIIEKLTGFNKNFSIPVEGFTPDDTVTAGNDPRLTDERSPTVDFVLPSTRVFSPNTFTQKWQIALSGEDLVFQILVESEPGFSHWKTVETLTTDTSYYTSSEVDAFVSSEAKIFGSAPQKWQIVVSGDDLLVQAYSTDPEPVWTTIKTFPRAGESFYTRAETDTALASTEKLFGTDPYQWRMNVEGEYLIVQYYDTDHWVSVLSFPKVENAFYPADIVDSMVYSTEKLFGIEPYNWQIAVSGDDLLVQYYDVDHWVSVLSFPKVENAFYPADIVDSMVYSTEKLFGIEPYNWQIAVSGDDLLVQYYDVDHWTTIKTFPKTGEVLPAHSELSALDYASAGHTGFQEAGDFATNTDLTTTSGTLQDQIDDIVIPTDFYSRGEVDTISGTLNTKIDTTSGTLQDEIDAIVIPTDFYTTGEVDALLYKDTSVIQTTFSGTYLITPSSARYNHLTPTSIDSEIVTLSGSFNENDFFIIRNENSLASYITVSNTGTKIYDSTEYEFHYTDNDWTVKLITTVRMIGGASNLSIVIGNDALKNLSVEDPVTYGVYIGHSAGYNNTSSCGRNTDVGHFAGYSNITGGSHVNVGFEAGYSTLGENNTMIGRSAGYNKTTADANVCVGYTAGASMSSEATGDENVIIGFGAGSDKQTGARNVIIGTDAGLSCEAASNCVFIGYQAGYSETDSDKLIIENSADLTNPLIYGDFSTGKVGIGTSSLVEALNVEGAIVIGAAAGTTNGTIRYTGTAMEGRISDEWVSLTSSGGGGETGAPGSWNETYTTLKVGPDALVEAGVTNTLIGDDVGNNITGGGRNVAIGYAAGENLTNGAENVMVGVGAGKAVTAGEGNVMIGKDAGRTVTGYVYDDVFIGAFAGYWSETGNNTHIGSAAGYANATGSDNTFIGKSAGRTGNGSYNVYVGVEAGYGDNGVANNNVYLGYQTGQYNTTGDGCVFIGYQVGQNDDVSNKLKIGNSSTATPLIDGDFDTADLTINGNLTVTETLTTNADVAFGINGWRMTVSGTDLLIQKWVTTEWITKSTISGS